MIEKLSVGAIIKQVNTVYEKDFNRKLKVIGITASQCEVLSYLFQSRQEENNQIDIEKHLNLKNPTVTGLLKRLEDKGFIFTVPSSSDKRCKNIHLTEKAYDIQRRMQMERKRIDRICTRGLTAKETDSLRRMLTKVLNNIAEP